jgi:short-subunit dehydrogenase
VNNKEVALELMRLNKLHSIESYYSYLDDLNSHNQELEGKDKEIERLTELCNKYEEEHKTTFETWQKDIKENEQLHSIIKEAREYIEHENFKRTILVGASTKKYTKDILNKVLEILDKVGEE